MEPSSSALPAAAQMPGPSRSWARPSRGHWARPGSFPKSCLKRKAEVGRFLRKQRLLSSNIYQYIPEWRVVFDGSFWMICAPFLRRFSLGLTLSCALHSEPLSCLHLSKTGGGKIQGASRVIQPHQGFLPLAALRASTWGCCKKARAKGHLLPSHVLEEKHGLWPYTCQVNPSDSSVFFARKKNSSMTHNKVAGPALQQADTALPKLVLSQAGWADRVAKASWHLPCWGAPDSKRGDRSEQGASNVENYGKIFESSVRNRPCSESRI